MIVHLVDGTYELFRQFFGRPGHLTDDGREVGAVRAVLRNTLAMLDDGATHVGVATDSVIESFRNQMYPGYKDGSEMDPLILAQFPLLDDGLRALGVATFGMIEFEADDGMASAAAVADADPDVEKVLICTPDKDLAQCVREGRVLQFDRRKEKIYDVADVIEKYGVPPESIADWLGLVGDSADGFPGLPGWGAKSAAAVLARYGHIEDIPLSAGQWTSRFERCETCTNAGGQHGRRHVVQAARNTRHIGSDDRARRRIALDRTSADLAAFAASIDGSDLVAKANRLAEGRS